jgi:multiple sugar transport system substrate-binding protein
MQNRDRKIPAANRRQVLAGSAALGAAALLPTWSAAAQEGPWSVRPDSETDNVQFFSWQYGDIYDVLGEKFTADWGVEWVSNYTPYNDYAKTLSTVFAAGDQIDTGPAFNTIFGVWIEQGILEPLDGLPGLDDYIADFTDLHKRAATYDGSVYGMPYYTTTWVWNYNQILGERAGFDAPFASYEEFTDQCLKAKKDGVSNYPIIWVAGAGPEHLIGTWASLAWNMHGEKFFDDQGNHQLGDGSGAREALKWLADTFTVHDISDPESLRVQMGGSTNAFKAGQHLYRGPNHHYGLRQLNDPAQSGIAGKVLTHGFPGNGASLANANVYSMMTAYGNKDWAWKQLQYLGGRTMQGEYMQGMKLMTEQMFGSGFKSIMESDALRDTWSQWCNVDDLMATWNNSAYIGDVIQSFLEPWHLPWTDTINIELQKCLQGEITADEACDNVIAGIEVAKRSI